MHCYFSIILVFFLACGLFFVGRHDRSLPPIVTEEFVNALSAPKKEIVWFEESGHEPLEEEPAKFNQAIAERVKN